MKPRGPCCTTFMQNDPGMCDSSLLHSMGICSDELNLLYAPQLSDPLTSVCDEHWKHVMENTANKHKNLG